jgi:hypothetical protein
MPKPVYILCCRSGSDDRNSGLASHFDVIDRLQLKQLHLPVLTDSNMAVLLASPIRIVAVWQATGSGDYEVEFESELRGLLPSSNTEVTFVSNKFRFDPGMARFRLTVEIPSPLFAGSGSFVAESRIRRCGETEWLKQAYDIDVVVLPSD